jgi:hypothetical protein
LVRAVLAQVGSLPQCDLVLALDFAEQSQVERATKDR